SSHFSNRIIKKGDFFTIYVDITNGHEEPIVLQEVKISQPMGFYPVTLEKLKKLQIPGSGRLSEFFRKLFSWSPMQQQRREEGEDFTFERMSEKIKGASIIHGLQDVFVEPKTSYNEIFTLQAGWTGGF